MCQWKLFLLTLASVVFVLLGMFMIGRDPFMAWLCIVLFGAAGLRGLSLMATESPSLQLDRDGFEMWGLVKRVRFRWADIESIRLTRVRHNQVIAISYRKGHPRRSSVSRSVGGMDASIGNVYETPLDALCKKMNEGHARYGRAARSSAGGRGQH